jgi:hypothetical protein
VVRLVGQTEAREFVRIVCRTKDALKANTGIDAGLRSPQTVPVDDDVVERSAAVLTQRDRALPLWRASLWGYAL